MSKTVKGRVQAVSVKPEKDFYGICIDDTWYNGNGDLQQNLEEAEVQLKVDDNTDAFIDIEEINVLEEANEDGQSRTQAMGEGSGNSNSPSNASSSNMSPRQAGITANSAVKMAAEHTDKNYSDDPQQYIDEVNEMSKAFNEMIKDRLRDNL
jgi:hypothetical protein